MIKNKDKYDKLEKLFYEVTEYSTQFGTIKDNKNALLYFKGTENFVHDLESIDYSNYPDNIEGIILLDDDILEIALELCEKKGVDIPTI